MDSPKPPLFDRLLIPVLASVVIVLFGFNYFAPQARAWQKDLEKLRSGSSGSSVAPQRVVDEQSAIIDAVEKASPAVVSVVARQVTFNPFTGPSTQESGIGTGFIIEADGLVLTNKHVVAESGARYRVVLKDGREYQVASIHRDPVLDLAILKIEAKDLPTLELGDSSKLKVGQMVVAIGNALGRFTNTVTTGVVSGIGRGITASSGLGRSEVLDDVIQTDAALNPGNSGGPLLNLSGRVIAINVAVTEGAQNIGFAIPINAVKPAVDEFKLKGKISRPFLGIEYVIITEDLSVLRKLPQGAYVQRVVDGSPADTAGVKTGDIITKLNGNDITEKRTLAEMIRLRKVGDEVGLTLDRNGQEVSLKVTLGEATGE